MTASFLVMDKPAGITSHDVVAAVRAVVGVKKVGHTGTLDPFATGVLALALGGATRLVQYLDESLKVYDATISLGTATDTGDPTGEVIRELPVPEFDEATVLKVLEGFLGERMQTPPPYSAVKVNGKPLYYYARRGETVEVKARPITVYGLDLLEFTPTTVRVELRCSRGTYARVIADEIAVALGTAGHLETLARLGSGPFLIGEALTMQQLSDMVAETPGQAWRDVLMPRRGKDVERVKWRPRDDVRASLLPHIRRPLTALSHLPLLDLDADGARKVRNGAALPGVPGGVAVGGRFLVVSGADVVAIAEATARGPKALTVVAPQA